MGGVWAAFGGFEPGEVQKKQGLADQQADPQARQHAVGSRGSESAALFAQARIAHPLVVVLRARPKPTQEAGKLLGATFLTGDAAQIIADLRRFAGVGDAGTVPYLPGIEQHFGGLSQRLGSEVGYWRGSKTKNRRFCTTSPVRFPRCGAVHPMRLSRPVSFHAAGPQSSSAPPAISRFDHLEQTATTPQIPKVGLVSEIRPGSLVFILSQSANTQAPEFNKNRFLFQEWGLARVLHPLMAKKSSLLVRLFLPHTLFQARPV